MIGLSPKRRAPAVLVAAVVATSVLLSCRERTTTPTTKPTRATTQGATTRRSSPQAQLAVGKAERAQIAKAVAEAFDQAIREHARAAKQLAALKPGVPVPYKHSGGFKAWGRPNLGTPWLNRSPAMEDLMAKCLAAREKGLASRTRAYVEAAGKYLTHKDATYRTVACEFLVWFPQYAVESDLTPAVGALLTDQAAPFEGVLYDEGQLIGSSWITRIDGGVRVSDLARRALARMTTFHFDNLEAFRSWWPRNKEYRRRLWYWSLRWRHVHPGHEQVAVHEKAALADLDDFRPGEALRMLLLARNDRAKLADCGLPPAAGMPQSKQQCPVRERSTYHPEFSPETLADFIRKHDLKGVLIRIVRQDPPWVEARGRGAKYSLLYTVMPVLPLALDKSDAALVAAEVKDPRGVLARDHDILAGLVKVAVRLDPKRAEGILVAQLKREPHQSLIAEELVRRTGLKHWDMIQAACPDRTDKYDVIRALAELRTPQGAAALGQWLAAEDWTPELNDYGYETGIDSELLLDKFVKAAAVLNGGKGVIAQDLLKRSRWRWGKHEKAVGPERMRAANKPVPAARAEVVARLKRFFARAAAQPAATRRSSPQAQPGDRPIGHLPYAWTAHEIPKDREVLAAADTLAGLVAKVRPDATWESIKFLWAEKDEAGKLRFRLNEACIHKPRDKAPRWVLLGRTKARPSGGYVASGGYVRSVAPLNKQIPVHDTGPGDYAVVVATDAKGGRLYQVGWESEMGGAGGSYSSRQFYVLHDKQGTWRIVGRLPDRPDGSWPEDRGYHFIFPSYQVHKVQWTGNDKSPVRLHVRQEALHFEGARFSEDEVYLLTLPSARIYRDGVFEGKLPAEVKWGGSRHLSARKDDTAEKIVNRLAIWTKDADDPRKFVSSRRAWRGAVSKMNPETIRPGKKIPAGTRINLPTAKQIAAAIRTESAKGMRGPDAARALLSALRDLHPGIRGYAARMLGKIGAQGELAAPSLAVCLKDEWANVRMEAAFALGKIGVAAQAAVPALEEALKGEKEARVRRAISEALKKIRAQRIGAGRFEPAPTRGQPGSSPSSSSSSSYSSSSSSNEKE